MKTILFEPWSLGDAIIATATARQRPKSISLACASRWIPLLKSAVPLLQCIPVDLDYTRRAPSGGSSRSRKSIWPRWLDESATQQNPSISAGEDTQVLSIRGDIRDTYYIRKLFPGADMKVGGWIPFIARRVPMLDLPFKRQWFAVKNRYRAWADLADVPFSEIENAYLPHTSDQRVVTLHLGAQWKSKQYPFISELVKSIHQQSSSDSPVQIVLAAASGDPLPPEVSRDEVLRLENNALIEQLKASSLVITNDSGPMHLSALLGCKTISIVRASNALEWVPPHVQLIQSSLMPKGYGADQEYNSDHTLEGWPLPETVARSVCFALKDRS